MKIEEAVAIVRDGVGESMKKVGFDLPALQEICKRHSEAMEVLAKEYVAQHREDDGELVPAGISNTHCGFYDLWLADSGEWTMHLYRNEGTAIGRVVLKQQPTMRQLRNLLQGLGVEQ